MKQARRSRRVSGGSAGSKEHRGGIVKLVAVWLAVGQVLIAVPTEAFASPRRQAPPEGPKVNRTVPKVSPPPEQPAFSAQPTESELFFARAFPEPLVPVLGTPSVQENQALATAILTYRANGGGEQTAPFEAFLEAHAVTPWRASLQLNLGILYRHTGYFTKALAAWEEAWAIAKGAQDARGRAVANRAVGELAELNGRLGRYERLEALFDEAQGRDIGGSAGQMLEEAGQGLWLMRNHPEVAFKCGPYAIDRILAYGKPNYRRDPAIVKYPSTSNGTSLAQMIDLARTQGLDFQMAQRTSANAEVLVPALIHWNAGHFAALVKAEGDRYLIQDPTFGEELWVSRRAFDSETSGYALVRAGTLPAGWRPVPLDEGGSVWGKGLTPANNPQNQKCSDNQSGGNAGGGCSNGVCLAGGRMAVYSFHTMLVNLHIVDSPVGYDPPRGPAVQFQVAYNQREVFQPQTFTYSNLGPKWTSNWLSYVEDDPNSQTQPTKVYLRGGGQETYPTNLGNGDYGYHPEGRAQLMRKVVSPIKYERRLPDGSVETYALSDGSPSVGRRVFLTQVTDPQGNSVTLSYDASWRLVQITDALEPPGQVTTLSYELPGDALKITKVTDPFGRFARFEYDGSGRLQRITDVIGIESSFTYTTGDFIDSMTTPYGTTSFSTGQWGARPGNPPGQDGKIWLEATDPLGAKERLEYLNDTTLGMTGSELAAFPVTVPTAEVPTGFQIDYYPFGAYETTRNTFFWDKRASALYPGDYRKAKLTHWLHTPDGALTGGVIENEKNPLETTRMFYQYPGQSQAIYAGSHATPSAVGKVMDDGSSQIYRHEYNALGKVCKATDPLGRETRYTYGTNNVADAVCTTGSSMDLLRVEQKNGANYDLVQSFTYNAKHEPLTVTDAAGQTTTYTYDTQWRIATVTTPPRAGITENRTTTYTYYADTAPTGAGRVQTITGPATGATTTYEYDGFGRVSRATDAEGYAISTAYDALDRPTTVTYPDGTYEQTIYNRLDAEQRRDRLGRWSRTFYDALRRVVALRDPAGRTTTYVWCNCGSLEAIRDGNGNTTTWQQDAQGRVTQETRADATFKTFVYENTTSRLKSVTDARNQTKTYGYAIDNRLTSTTYSVAATPNVTFSYMDPDNPSVPDPYGRLRLMTGGTGTTRYDYKPVATLGAGNLSTIDGPLVNDTVSYTYDELGRVTTRGLSTFSTTAGYDVLGRLATLTSPMGNFLWTYVNTTGRPQTVTYPNGQTTTLTYFPNLGDQRLQQIKHQQTSGGTVLSQFDYTYDAAGNIKTWTQQRGTDAAKVYTLGYDPADELSTATVTGPTPLPVPSRFRYAYDDTGNRSAEELDDAVTGATYNNLNQLSSRQPGGTVLFRGTVSEPATVTVQGKPAKVASDNTFAAQAQVGSLDTDVAVAATDPSGNTRTNTYQVSQSGSTTTYTYDGNGNLAGDGTRTFEWDAENRLTRVTQGGPELARFTYDGQGRRAQKIAGSVTHTYVYDDTNIIEERLSSGQTYDFVQGPGVDRPLAMRDQASVVNYYLADHLGSIAQTTSAAAAVTLTREYDPWGNPIQGSTTAGYAFTGREWDSEISAYYYRARYYDPKIGRFVSEDPIRFKGGINFYSYVENNPTNFVDPDGLQTAQTGPYYVTGQGWVTRPVPPPTPQMAVQYMVVTAGIAAGVAAPAACAAAKPTCLAKLAMDLAFCMGFTNPAQRSYCEFKAWTDYRLCTVGLPPI